MRRVPQSLISALAGVFLLSGVAMADGLPPAPPMETPSPGSITYAIGNNVTVAQVGWISDFVNEIAAEWTHTFGWTTSRPIIVRLYANGIQMASNFGYFRLMPLTNDELVDVSSRPGIGVLDARPPLPGGGNGGWVILINTNAGTVVGTPDAPASQTEIKGVLVHEMARAMLLDLAGPGGPPWFREGILDLITNSEVQGLANSEARLSAWSSARGSGTLPSLVGLDRNWNALISAPAGPVLDTPYAVADQAVFYLSQRVGGMPLIEVLRRASAGEDFEGALRQTTGLGLALLDDAYRAWTEAALIGSPATGS